MLPSHKCRAETPCLGLVVAVGTGAVQGQAQEIGKVHASLSWSKPQQRGMFDGGAGPKHGIVGGWFFFDIRGVCQVYKLANITRLPPKQHQQANIQTRPFFPYLFPATWQTFPRVWSMSEFGMRCSCAIVIIAYFEGTSAHIYIYLFFLSINLDLRNCTNICREKQS